MKIQGIEIILDGALPTDELVGYVERARDLYGDKFTRLSVKIDGDMVELDHSTPGVPFERIRRITGYLQKTGQWNNAKKEELQDRVVHEKGIDEDELQSDVRDYLNPHRMVGGEVGDEQA